jgi:O-antigen ligase
LALMDASAAAAMFFLSANVFKSPAAFTAFLRWTVPCAWFQALLTLVAVAATHRVEIVTPLISSHPALAYFLPIPEIFYGEKMGSLVNANILAVFILPISLLLGFRIAEEWREKKIVSLFWSSGLVAALVSLLLAKSASAWMCAALALIGWGVWARGPQWVRAHKEIAWAAVAAVGLLVAGVALYKFMHVVDRSVDPHRDNINRLYWWRSAWRMFLDYRWFGVGLGNYGSAYLSYKTGGSENTLYAHGFPPTFLAETGAVGFAAVAVFAVAFVRRVRSFAAAGLRVQSVLTAVLAVVLFCAINIGLEYLVNLLMLAALLGAAAASVPAVSVRPRLSAVILIAGAALSAVPFLVSPFFAGRSVVAARAALDSGDTARAERQFKDAIELDPREWESYEGLARVAAATNQPDSAVAWQEKALELNRLNWPVRRQLENYRDVAR